jgi:sugar phosphate isomerase/epimerase
VSDVAAADFPALDRRRFLGGALAALAAAAIPDALGAAGPSPAPAARLDRIGLQLYTVRQSMEKDLPGTLARVATIGYREVEFAGYFGREPAEIRELLEKNHLSAPSSHVALERLRSEPDRVIEEARVAGHRYVVCPWLDEKQRTPEGYAALIDTLGRTDEALRQAGLGLAYHNHDFEFATLPDGQRGFDLILERTDPAIVQLEMDLFWAVKGGADPLAYFARWPGRFPMVHVKDMDAAGAMTDVGKGRIDFAAIFAARRRAGIRHFFVEHDEPADAWASITASYAYLKRLRFGDAV